MAKKSRKSKKLLEQISGQDAIALLELLAKENKKIDWLSNSTDIVQSLIDFLLEDIHTNLMLSL